MHQARGPSGQIGRMLIRTTAAAFVLLFSAAGRAPAEAPPYPQLASVPERFTFLINADPQIGPCDSPVALERRLCGLLKDFVAEAEALRPRPAFVLYNGDLVAFNRSAYFEAFRQAAGSGTLPVVLVHGNHDGRHGDRDFLDVQEALSGFRRLYYSFDCGRWHFVILPCPEMLPGPDARRELVAWLDADLAASRDRPTMVFLHYHLLPVGLSQCEYYTLPMSIKRALIETFARHGQVRHVISGHVHAGIQSSIKCSWTWRGTNYIVAPSPVPPRAFGEEFPEFLADGARNEGYYLAVDIDGDRAVFRGRKIGSPVERVYPGRFGEFSEQVDPRAFEPVWKLPPGNALVNGDFENGLEGWLRPHRYLADEEPGFAWRTGTDRKASGQAAAWLAVREKGEAWAYDEFVELYQPVRLAPDAAPVFSAKFNVPASGRSCFGGGYVRIAAGSAEGPAFAMWFHFGARETRVRHVHQAVAYADHGAPQGMNVHQKLADARKLMCWPVPDYADRWQDLRVNVAGLYDAAVEQPGAFRRLGADRMVVALGVWCGMEKGACSGAWFDDVRLQDRGEGGSTINGSPLVISPRIFQPPYGRWYLDHLDK